MDETPKNIIDGILDEGGDVVFFPEARISEPNEFLVSATSADFGNSDESGETDETIETDETSETDETDVIDETGETETTETASPLKSSKRKGKEQTGDELPREKSMRLGMNALTDAELLALLLGSGIKGKSVFEFAREILEDNNNRLAVLARRDVPELMRKYKGLGLAKATLLRAAMTFGQRAQADLKVPDRQITSSTSVYEFMRDKLERNNHEEFWILHLSRANRVMLAEQLSKGGTAATVVDVKLIVKSAIDHISSGIIVCHNHPSGNMTPSGQDDTLTHRIVETCKLCDVNVLDHVIIGPTGYYSYKDEGRLR